MSADDIRAAQSGDEAAFTRIYRATQSWLVKYVAVLAGDRRDADDLCAETWLHVCRDLHSFSGDGDKFRAWIVTIARNRAIDASRARQRRPVHLLAPADMPTVGIEASGEDAALGAMSTADALRAIAELPTEQAEAVLLRAVLGLDAKTAGRMLGRRPGAVRTAAYRGLRRLADRYPTGTTQTDTSLGAASADAVSDGL